MNIPAALAVLAGARRDVLAKAPGDLPKHAAMGGVLLSTATVAGVSAFYALHSVFELPWQLCALGGLAWAVVILNLDRMLVITMNRASGLGLKIATAVPRLLLALVIGWVISIPLVLQVFQREIEAQMTVMKAEAIAESNRVLDETYQQIEKLGAKRKELEDAIAGRTPPLSENPDVKAAEAALATAEATFQTLDLAAQAELDGTGGTKVEGAGEAYRQKRAAADNARRIRDEAARTLEETRTRVKEDVETAAASAVAAARNQLPGVERELATEQERRRVAENEAHRVQENNTGLLTRLEALDRVTAGHPTAVWAHRMLFLLFVCIEVLPVMAKLLSSLGPPSLYDRLAEREDEHADYDSRIKATCERDIAQTAADARVAVARLQANGQIQAGQVATEALAAQQQAIALRAIDAWSQVATERTKEELDRWHRELEFRDFR